MINKKELTEYLCSYFDKSIEEITIKSRKREIILPRHMIMTYLSKYFILSDVGRIFNLDHSTVIHAKKAINNLISTDRKFVDTWNDFYTYANAFFGSVMYKDVEISFTNGAPTVIINSKIILFDNIRLSKIFIDGYSEGLKKQLEHV